MQKISLMAGLSVILTTPLLADVSMLRDQLLSTDVRVSSPAISAAAALPAGERKLLVMSLIGPLRRDPESARAAAVALRCCADMATAALPDLVEALRYDDPAVAAEVGATLAQIGPASLRYLTKGLEDPSFIMRQRSAEVLGKFGAAAKPAAAELAMCLVDDQNQVQSAAADALLKIGDPAVDAIKGALKRADVEGRKTLVGFLGRLGPVAAPVLVQRLREDESPSVRTGAANALALLQPPAPNVVPALVETLRQPNEYLRLAAINALGQLGTASHAAIGPLIASSQKDSEALARQRATEALTAIGKATKESQPGLVNNLKDTEPNVRRLTVVALSESEIPAADIAALLGVSVKDNSDQVRLTAIHAAAALVASEPGAVSVLRIALSDPMKNNRYAAMMALGDAKADPATAAAALEAPLKDIDINGRNMAIQSLAKLGAPAVPVLLRQLLDSYAALRDNAEQAILMIGPDAIPALEKAQAGADPFLQKKIPALIQAIQANRGKTK